MLGNTPLEDKGVYILHFIPGAQCHVIQSQFSGTFCGLWKETTCVMMVKT